MGHERSSDLFEERLAFGSASALDKLRDQFLGFLMLHLERVENVDVGLLVHDRRCRSPAFRSAAGFSYGIQKSHWRSPCGAYVWLYCRAINRRSMTKRPRGVKGTRLNSHPCREIDECSTVFGGEQGPGHPHRRYVPQKIGAPGRG